MFFDILSIFRDLSPLLEDSLSHGILLSGLLVSDELGQGFFQVLFRKACKSDPVLYILIKSAFYPGTAESGSCLTYPAVIR